MFGYERRHQPLASKEVFHRRLVRSGILGFIMVVISLAVGMAGYALLEGLGALDSFVNAAMILSGMGPLHAPLTPAGKIFAGLYALYSGFAVLVIAAIAFAPFVHRVLHRFHLEEDENDGRGRTGELKPRRRR
jgi:ABC-type glycerol-3-phosphate transport system permease component